MQILLSKHKENRDIEFAATVSFNCSTKAVIIYAEYMLDKSFQEILYRIHN